MFASPFTRTIAASSVTSPSSTEVNPTVLAIPKNSCSRGRRRSQHTKPTRLPARASATARFDNVAVLPSPALGLVICRVCTGRSRAMNWIAVRSDRKASALGENGSAWDTT